MGSKDVQIVLKAKDEASKNIGGVRGNIKSLTSDVGALKTGLMGIAGVALLGPMVMNVAGAVKEWGLAVDDIVDQTGAAGEEASKLLVIAKRTGIGVEESAGFFAKFGKSISMARDEMAKANASGEQSNDIFSRMGFTFNDLSKSSMYEVFQMVTDKMRDMADGADKDRVAMEMFGKSGYKMHDMLSISRDEMQKTIDKAAAMGLIISGETAAAWEQFDRNLTEVKGTVSRLAIGIGNELLPSLENLLTKVENVTAAWGTLDEAQRKSAARSIELVAEVGGVVAVLWGAEKAAMALKGALLLLTNHPIITLTIATAYIGGKMAGSPGVQGAVDNALSEWGVSAPIKPGADYGDYLQREMQGGAFDPPKVTPPPGTSLRPVTPSGGGGAKELDSMREKLANMITDFNAKIMQEVGTTFDGNVAKLSAEITKASRELDEMAAKGIDVSEGRASLNKYGKVMTDKYTKEQTQALLTLKNDTATINAEITGDYVAAAEAQYQATLLSIQEQVDKRKAASGNTTEVLKWEVSAVKQAEQKKLQAVIEGDARKHEQRLTDLQYQRDMLGMTGLAYTAAYQAELQSFINANTLLLQNAALTEEKRARLKQETSSAMVKLHELEGQNISTAWREANRRMEVDSYDYAGRIVQAWQEMGSGISSSLLNAIKGTGDGLKGIFNSITDSLLKMWLDMWTQMYIMAPMKKLFFGIMGAIGGGGGSPQGFYSPGFAEGGLQRGPGTGTSDSILSRLSNGEYVIKAAAVNRYGVGLFDSLNQMRVPAFASGGSVGRRSVAGLANVAPKVEINVVNQTGTQAKARQTSSFSSETNTFILSVFLEALEGNHGGVRDAVRGVAAG